MTDSTSVPRLLAKPLREFRLHVALIVADAAQVLMHRALRMSRDDRDNLDAIHYFIEMEREVALLRLRRLGFEPFPERVGATTSDLVRRPGEAFVP